MEDPKGNGSQFIQNTIIQKIPAHETIVSGEKLKNAPFL